ncbi:Bug family tripartite tricarboxylate transporter substrate binding protein [Desulfocurvus sp. DL9XJH121]
MFKAIILSLTLVLGMAAVSNAGDFPTKPIQVVVPWKPGGGSDISSRIMSEGLQGILPQPLVVSNISGSMGLNAALHVLRSKADGYTCIWEHPGNLAISPMLAHTPFTWRDFDPVCIVAKSDSALVVRADSPFNTAQDAFDYIKANPAKIRWSLAINGVSHFSYLAICDSLKGLDVTVVPAPGDKNRIVSLLSNNSDITMVGYAAAAPYVKSGDLKILAMVNTERSPFAPEIPTLMEQGINAYYDYAYSVLVAKNTPKAVKDTLAQGFKKALDNPKTLEALKAQCLSPYFKDADQMAKAWGDLQDSWTKLAVKYQLIKK